jgi:hypothetical protein
MDGTQFQILMEQNREALLALITNQQQGMAAQQQEILRLQVAAAAAGDRGRGQQPKLIAKYVNIGMFKGVLAEWDDWSFTFKRTVRSMNKEAFDFMVKCEDWATDVTDEKVRTGLDIANEHGLEVIGEADPERVLRSGELFDILCQVCGGEALSLVKSVTDLNGFAAWQTLYRKYNPKTMARGVRLLCEVTNPGKIVDMGGIETAITKWEERLATLKTQFQEGFSDWTKIAIFTNMMPTNIQDYVYSITETRDAGQAKMSYQEVKDKVRGMVSNKVAMNMGPAPMDVGGILGLQGKEEWQEEGEYDVGAVNSNTKCYRCQGYGHMSRDCATKPEDKDKGKGKGQSLPGKGTPKGLGKGDQEKGKGKGKGQFAGNCFRCGKAGHRSADCYVKVNGLDEEEAEAEVPIGGVWMIGAVEATESGGEDDDWKIVEKRVSSKRKSRSYWKKIPDDLTEQVMIAEVEVSDEKSWTRPSGLLFNVADVAKPLASAVKVCKAGNKVVLDLSAPGMSYVESHETGERMMLTEERGTFVFEVEFMDDGKAGKITLDSGAGVSVWPKALKTETPILPPKAGLKMVAANGTKIENFGQRLVTFKGLRSPFTGRA